MTAYRRFGEVTVGDFFPEAPLSFEIGAPTVSAFLSATGDDSAADKAQEHAPSMIASVYLIALLKARRSPPGGIHAKQAIRFHRTVTIGERLSLQGRVVEKYVRKDRPYVVSDFEARGEDGTLVSSGRITTIWGPDP